MYSVINPFFRHAHLIRPLSINCAVAIVITRQSPSQLLFIERARRTDDPWSGDVAFPGGKKNFRDLSLAETARRETREECGLILPPHPAPIRLRDRITKAHSGLRPMTISPFVFFIDKPEETHKNHEVASCFWVPIDSIINAERKKMRWKTPLFRLTVPYIPLGRRRLWGLTLSMVDELVPLLKHL